MSVPLRVGVIGCGAIAQVMHIPHLLEYDEKFQLVALADMNPAVLAAVADHFHISHRYVDWGAMLEREDIDAVLICHAGSHRDSVIAALDLGKHVLVEKPLAWNLREVQEVAARASDSDCVVQLGYHKLYDPAFAYAREQVGKMPDLAYARITVHHADNALNLMPYRIRRGNSVVDDGLPKLVAWDDYPDYILNQTAGGALAPLVDEALGARKDERRLRVSYGELIQSIIHHIYTMFGFLGAPTRIIHADVWRNGLSLHLIVEYPNSVRCILDWHTLPYLNDYREEYAFVGNHDRVFLTFPGPYYRNFPTPVTILGGEKELSWEKRIIVSYEEAFARELLAFHDNVQEGKKPLSSVDDAVAHTRFIQQVIDAVR
jgi:predicted dehydrogenase